MLLPFEQRMTSHTWYGTGVLDSTENLTAPQWQLPFSSIGMVVVTVVDGLDCELRRSPLSRKPQNREPLLSPKQHHDVDPRTHDRTPVVSIAAFVGDPQEAKIGVLWVQDRR